MSTANSSPKPFNIAIVGGGIAGLTLAIALLDHDIDVTIYEGAPHFSEIGAGVAFGPNAAEAMKLISPKIFDAFKACRTSNLCETKKHSWFTVRVGDARKADKDGFVKPGVKLGQALFDVETPPGNESGGVYRSHFLDELIKHIPEGIAHFNKRLDDIYDAKDGSGDKVLHFADGTTAQHNLVIGCDGIKSRTRPIVLGENDPAAHAVFSGKYAYRGLIPMDQAVELLGEEVAQNSQMFFGYHGHLLTFPIEKGKIMNVVAFSSRDTWDDEKWVVTTSKEQMHNDFAEWGPLVKKIVGAMQKPDIWALFNHPPCNTFVKGRICLLGDSAHATTPHQGAGAGMCIEDSYILANLIKDAKSVADVEKAFIAYDHARRERTQKNVKTSYEGGQMYEFEYYGDDLDKIQESLQTRMKWLWDFDLENHLREAQKVMHEGVKV